MKQSSSQFAVYLVVGKKRTFACALDWPGWCRGGRDEVSALQALLDCGPRYAEVLRLSPTQLGFQMPADLSGFTVTERLEGTTGTDFGVPDVAPSADTKPVDKGDLQRFQALLKACWQAFDGAAMAAAGKELRKGPRGGGRDLDGITRHVLGADAGYLSQVAWKLERTERAGPEDDGRSLELDRTRQAVLSALTAAAHGEVAARGPRGGVRWTPRYFVRRVAWHVLDHAWEIEDRAI
jgi:hypothetical protein